MLPLVPKHAWTPAYNADGKPRDGAWVTEITGMVDLPAWPEGTRLILRKERPRPGAQLRFTDTDGLRITGFLTNTAVGQLPDLELRHRRHARAEDRIRAAKDNGLRNLPFHNAPKTRSGWKSARWRPISSPGPNASLAPAGPKSPGPNDFACVCSPSPAGSSPPLAGASSKSPKPGPGPTPSPPRITDSPP